MTQNENGSYGIQWPRWYVYWRGRRWLAGKFGCCPNCYSSPPNDKCFICEGNYNYAYRLSAGDREKWRTRWDLVREVDKTRRSRKRAERKKWKKERRHA